MTGRCVADDAPSGPGAPAHPVIPPERYALGYRDALHAIVHGVKPVGTETVALEHAAGRALAAPVVSRVALPLWDNAGMDGYAVRKADVAAASDVTPVTLTVIGTATAGVDPRTLPRVEPGTAVRIMTGAPVPPGADAVIRIEDTNGGTEHVQIVNARDCAGRANVRVRGEEVGMGDTLFAAGDTLSASHIGVLASVGCALVLVYRKPRVTMISGGNELVLLDRFDDVMAQQRIVASSTYSLPVLLQAAGAEVTVAPLVADTLEDTTRAVHAALAGGCDVVITTGGVSVGAHDYTKSAIIACGGAIDFWRARIRPGGPVGFGRIDRSAWLGLPGNPVSTMVTGALFAWPLVRALGGHTHVEHRALSVRFCDRYPTPAALTYFVRVTLSRRDDGGYDAHLAGAQGSNVLRTMANADALMVIPETCEIANTGDVFDALLVS